MGCLESLPVVLSHCLTPLLIIFRLTMKSKSK